MLCGIAKELPPSDLDSFTMSCKYIRDVCDDLLEEHQRCKKIYGTLIFDRDPEAGLDSIFFVLETLRLKPQLIHYVKAVKFLHRHDHWLAHPDGEFQYIATEDKDRVNTERTAGFRQLVLASPLIQAKGEWCQAILDGNDECAFALLLSMLTNLRTVTVMLPRVVDTHYTDALVRSISNMQHQGARPPSALVKLHRLRLVEEPQGLATIRVEQLLNWINIGTLRHLYASCVSLVNEINCDQSNLSRVESLDLDDCELTDSCPERLIKMLPRLKDFRYRRGRSLRGYRKEDYRDFHLDEVCLVLSKRLSTTLQKLVLLTDMWPGWYIEPLSSFTKLKTIGFDMTAFYDHKSEKPDCLAELFPVSVRTIQFRNANDYDIPRSFWVQFKDLKTSLPNVVTLQLCGHWSIDTSEIAATCRQAGIRFELITDPRN